MTARPDPAALAPPLRALALVNPGARRAGQGLDSALARLRASGAEVAVETFSGPDEIAFDIARRAGDFDALVICGGDGTLMRALPAILEAGLPLGVLPMGTANDLARTLGIPLGLVQAAAIIGEGRTRRIDLGWINGSHFFNVASIGLSVRIARRLTRDRKERWGATAYLACAWEAMHRQRSFQARIVVDGQAHEVRTMQIAVGNGRHYGGGMTIVDDAAIDDDRLDLYALPRLPGWRLLVLLPILRWGLHRPVQSILSLHGREIHVETERPMRVNVDGEIVARTPARFRVIPGAIEVFAPAG